MRHLSPNTGGFPGLALCAMPGTDQPVRVSWSRPERVGGVRLGPGRCWGDLNCAAEPRVTAGPDPELTRQHPDGQLARRGGGRAAWRALRDLPVADFPDPDLVRGYDLTVSGPVPLAAARAPLVSGWALLLSLHLPLASFGRYAWNVTVTTPLPVDPANFPVLAAPSTV